MVQAILILMLTEEFKFDDERAYLLFAVYGSMAFLTPVIGGYIADRWIGFKRAVFIGGVLLIAGYALMALKAEGLLFFGMGLVVVGTGFFKPNIAALVGDLYRQDDPRREGGFTLFYLGVNIGMLIPPLIAGYVITQYGWGFGFWIALVSLVVSLVQFLTGHHLYPHAGNIPATSFLYRGKRKRFVFFLITGIVIFVVFLQYLFIYPSAGDFLLAVASVSILGTVFAFLARETPERKSKFIACLVLIFLAMGFWAIYNQIYTSMTLFAERNMTKRLAGIPIDAEMTQFFNPFFILLLCPVFGLMWTHLNDRKAGPSTPMKFSSGLLCMAVGMFILTTGTSVYADSEGMVSPWWIVASNLFIAAGELLLYPIALAMIHRLAPPHLYGMMMGVWSVSIAGAFALGGKFAVLASVPETVSVVDALPIYSHAFFLFGCIALGLAVLGFSISPYLKRLIGEVRR